MRQQQDLPNGVHGLTNVSTRIEGDSDEDSTGDDSSESASVHDSDVAFVEAVSDFDSSDRDDEEYQTPSEGSSEHWEDESDCQDDVLSTHDSVETSETTSSHEACDQDFGSSLRTLCVDDMPVDSKVRCGEVTSRSESHIQPWSTRVDTKETYKMDGIAAERQHVDPTVRPNQ